MRLDIFVTSILAKEQIIFYTEELKLFSVEQDYGMGSILLKYVKNNSIKLILTPGEIQTNKSPLFSISTDDLKNEFNRIKNISFLKGGLVLDKNGYPQLIEYPLGKFFCVQDPSGNILMISEWN